MIAKGLPKKFRPGPEWVKPPVFTGVEGALMKKGEGKSRGDRSRVGRQDSGGGGSIASIA